MVNQTLTELQHTMLNVVETFENGKPNTYGNTYYNPTTHELSGGLLMASWLSGNMGKLLEAYIKNGGKAIDQKYITSATAAKPDPNALGLSGILAFKEQFKTASEDPIMQETQNNFFANEFLFPAEEHAKQLNITEPLGILVMLDSTVQGGLHNVLSLMGGDYNKYNQWDMIRNYLAIRRIYLNSHTSTSHTTYRIDVLESFVKVNNWKLDKPLNIFSQNFIIK